MASCCATCFRRVASVLLVGLTCALCIGCGLGEYEELMRKNRLQSKGGDEDRKLLGEPLELPAIKEGDTSAPMLTAADVFLRPPKLFQCKPAPLEVGASKFAPQVSKSDKTVPIPGKQPGEHITQLYEYAGAEGCHIFLAAMQSDYLELSDADRAVEANEFKRSVWNAFLAYLQQRRLPKDAPLPTTKDLRDMHEAGQYRMCLQQIARLMRSGGAPNTSKEASQTTYWRITAATVTLWKFLPGDDPPLLRPFSTPTKPKSRIKPPEVNGLCRTMFGLQILHS